MDKPTSTSLHDTVVEVRRMLQQPGSESAPSGHDILNALHTVLSSIEMLEMDITKPQREVFDRLELGAKHLEELLVAFIESGGKSKSAIVAKCDAALQSV